jgi:hypothetical protein
MKRFVLVLPVAIVACATVLAQDVPTTPARRVISLARHFDEKPPIVFEPIPSSNQPGRGLVTNLHQANLTAFVIQVSSDIDNPKPATPSMLVFDALARQGMISTIPRGLSLSVSVPYLVSKQVPVADLVAALWEDGSTFGPADIVDELVRNRRATLAAYDLVIPILQKAMDTNWTISECIDALEQEKVPPPSLKEPPRIGTLFQPNTEITATEIMLRSNQSATSPPRFFKGALTILRKNRDELAAALPDEETAPVNR